ncbi:MAG: helix-turn-helix domain-containing protein [Bacteroidales bacterium]|nr:helix-turn-helix domain-containing protein [Bacteroidales bacterium]MCF8390003.1 helix-turn-helix domain-containing protein [Bacteroidales bacterium]
MNKIIGKNLKAWRVKLGYSQEIIAEYLGISRENISYYETGEREIPVKHLEKVSELFGIEPDLLFEENMKIQDTEMALAFRNDNNLSVDSLQKIAQFKKIVRNYLMMDSKMKN